MSVNTIEILAGLAPWAWVMVKGDARSRWVASGFTQFVFACRRLNTHS